jgi:hypothetical protein
MIGSPAEKALRKILSLHKAEAEHPDRPEYLWCKHCKDKPWPCETAILAGADPEKAVTRPYR